MLALKIALLIIGGMIIGAAIMVYCVIRYMLSGFWRDLRG